MKDHQRFVTAEMYEQLEAEVAQLRQERDIFAQRNATQALTIHLKREAWFAEKTRADVLEAARDHLRARLRQLAAYVQHKAGCAANQCQQCMRWTDSHDVYGWTHDLVPFDCTCGLADLLAVLTEPPQQETHEKTNTNADPRSAETDVTREVALPQRED